MYFNEIKKFDIKKLKLETEPEFSTKCGNHFNLTYKNEPIKGVERIRIVCDSSLDITRVIIRHWYKKEGFAHTIYGDKVLKGVPQMDMYLKNLRFVSHGYDNEIEAMRNIKIYDKNGDDITSIASFDLVIGNSSTITEVELVTC